jgi:hypothetical protein
LLRKISFLSSLNIERALEIRKEKKIKDIHIRQNHLALSFHRMSSKDAIEDFPLEYKKCTKNEKKTPSYSTAY